jgi:molybdenum cofactor cytidylyltransferase
LSQQPPSQPGAAVFAVVLAAGESRRFGSAKQLADFRGQPLVARAMRLAEQSCGQRSILVAGSEWQRVAAACAPLAGYLVVNEDFTSGMGGSIAAAVGAIAGIADAVLILLADQPLIDADYLARMVATWSANPAFIVASEFDATAGPPVIFPARHFDALLSLSGDRGARHVLMDPSSRTMLLHCSAAAVDIDVPEDFTSIVKGVRSDR